VTCRQTLDDLLLSHSLSSMFSRSCASVPATAVSLGVPTLGSRRPQGVGDAGLGGKRTGHRYASLGGKRAGSGDAGQRRARWPRGSRSVRESVSLLARRCCSALATPCTSSSTPASLDAATLLHPI
jgi:hypothetical protein